MTRTLTTAVAFLFVAGCVPWHPHGKRHHHDRGHDVAPGGNGGGQDPGGPGQEPGPGEQPVDSIGTFAAVEISVLPQEAGRDLDGDGTPDNNLGKVFEALAEESGDAGWDPEAELVRLVEEGLVVPLLDAVEDPQTQQLSIAVATGFLDDDGVLVVHPASFDEDGGYHSVLTGAFSSEEAFLVGPGPVTLPANADGALVQLPFRQTELAGTMSPDLAVVTLTGVIPAAQAIELAIAPYLGDDGVDTDGDGQIDMTSEEVLDMVEAMADDPELADIVLSDGGRGVSAALTMVLVDEGF